MCNYRQIDELRFSYEVTRSHADFLAIRRTNATARGRRFSVTFRRFQVRCWIGSISISRCPQSNTRNYAEKLRRRIRRRFASAWCARRRQFERFGQEKRIYANVHMPPKLIRKHCEISGDGEKLLETAVMRLGLWARAHDRILKVARTIADLDSAADITSCHLSDAIRYRTLDRTYWA